MGTGNLILLVLDVALFAALVYYIWKADQLEESSFRKDIQKIAEKNEREEEQSYKEKFERKAKKLEQVRETLEETREELAERKKELSDCQEELRKLREERPERNGENHRAPETTVVGDDAEPGDEDNGTSPTRRAEHDGTGMAREQDEKETDPAPEPSDKKRLLDQGLLPTWKLVANHPRYENLRQVFNVHKAPNKFQVAPFSPGEEILEVMDEHGAEDIADRVRTLSDLRSELEEVLSDSLFAFFEDLSVKGKTITQLERNPEANEDPFWRWFLRETLDVQLSEPDFMQEEDLRFQPFLDHLIDYRRGKETRKTEYVNALFDRTVEALRQGVEDDPPLVRLHEHLSGLTRKLDQLQERTNELRGGLSERVISFLNDPAVNEEALDRQNLLREVRNAT